MKPDDPNRPQPSRIHDFMRYTSLGLQMVITLAIAGTLGYFIDQWIGWQFPVFLLLLIMVALAGSIYLLIKRTNE